MNKNIQIFFTYFDNRRKSIQVKRFRGIFFLLSGLLMLPVEKINSEEIFLRCVGKFEINRGALIKPDWETSYLTINLDGLKSTIYDKGIKKYGRTIIRRNSYTIKHRDKRNSIKNIYKINATHGNYIVESPQIKRTLIGTCQKGKG